MDAFVKKFFPEFDAPGAEFSFGNSPARLHTYFHTLLRVDADGTTQNRPFYVNQPMTPLGLMTAQFGSSVSSLDGISKPYLTPEGVINLNVIGDVLKSTGGMATNLWSQHMGMVKNWSWADNHVTLLVNMLRYVLIKRIQSETDTGLDAGLGEYDDGHITIDSDQWFGAAYPAAADWNGWPFTGIDNIPTYARLTDTAPGEASEALDLRNLSPRESAFVLLMCADWGRKSRLRLDFQLPALGNNFHYRAEAEAEGFAGWITGTRAEGQQAPAPPSWEDAWTALKKYVNQNRLYDHFSTALYVIACATYQFAPVTAESQAWLSINWHLSLPRFSSIRGRYTFLNEDEAAFISHRALNEWSYFSVDPKRINLLCLVFSQAYHTGMAVRNVRRAIHHKLDDIYSSDGEVMAPISMVSASAAEAVRSPVPLSGMSGVYMHTTVNIFEYDEDRRIDLAENDAGDDHGYDLTLPPTVTQTRVVRRAGTALNANLFVGDIAPTGGPNGGRGGNGRGRGARGGRGRGGRDGGRTASTSAVAAAVGATPITGDDEGDEGEIPVEIADDVNLDAYFEVVTEQVFEGATTLSVPWYTFPGFPTLLVPIDPMPGLNIFTLKGSIDESMLAVTRWGSKMNAANAWYVSNLYRQCGYDLRFSSAQGLVGGDRFYAPNNISFTWPVLYEPDHEHDEITINVQSQRQNHFIYLPSINNSFFKGKKIEFAHRILRRGTTPVVHGAWEDISETFGIVQMFKDMTVAYNTSSSVSRLKAYITRTEAGFQFAENVQAGVIPPQPDQNVAPNVGA
nr:coat protein [Carrot-associated toti-like virus]